MSSPRVWFITGTSTGFGRRLTELVLSKGEIAVATARRPSALDDLKEKYTPDRLLILKLDVTQPREIVAAFATVKETFGRLDVVVNNAAGGLLTEVEAAQDADMRAMFEINFWGAANVTSAAVQFFREVNAPGVGGRLLQISSKVGIGGEAAMGYYSASKFALEGLTESLAAELDPAWNIKVTLIEPGGFQTEAVNKAAFGPEHPAYSSNPELPSSRLRRLWGTFALPGDPWKAVEAFYEIAALPEPPLHLPLGKDSVEFARRKAAKLTADTDKYEYFSENLDIQSE
ncbi:NAD-P-binding protein [Trametes meyenii]|nr:NAD-P-binding protein [Trametes meyenii]